MSLQDYTKPDHLHPAELDRERAYHAQLAIDKLLNSSLDKCEIKSWIEKLPALIQTNGLGQALAFYKSRTNVKSAQEIYNTVGEWLKTQIYSESKNDDVLQWLTKEATPEQYRRAQAETQAYLRWLKQLAKAYLKNACDQQKKEQQS